MKKIILKGRLDGVQRNRLKGLLNMMYTAKQFADVIGIHIDQIYAVYVPLECPHERDERNHIFINGKEFAEWYIKVYAKQPLKQDETFCKTCKSNVKIYMPVNKNKNGLVYVLSVCPNCGRKLTKIIENKRVP